MTRWTPDKIAALLLLIGCLCLIAMGIDGEVKSILTIAAGYLFGTGISDTRARHRNKKQ